MGTPWERGPVTERDCDGLSEQNPLVDRSNVTGFVRNRMNPLTPTTVSGFSRNQLPDKLNTCPSEALAQEYPAYGCYT